MVSSVAGLAQGTSGTSEPGILVNDALATGGGGANPPTRDEALCPQAATWTGRAAATERASGPRGRVEVVARLRTRRLRQDDAAHRVAGRGTGRADQWAACRLAVARQGRQRSRVLLDLCDRRAAESGTGGWRERAHAPPGAPTAPDPHGADHAAQRPRCIRERPGAGA